MNRNDDRASVRVEIDADSSGFIPIDDGSPADQPGEGERDRSSLMMFLGVGALAVAVSAGVLFLRPDEDEAADGSIRGTTTTQPVAQAPMSAPAAADETEPEGLGTPVSPEDGSTVISALQPVDGLSLFPQQIIESGGGYIALGASDGQRRSPVLFASAAGSNWVRLEGRLAEDVVTSPTEDVDVRYWYGAMGAVGDGLAISVLEELVDISSGETTMFRVRRLLTADGSTWIPDREFPVYEVEGLAAVASFNTTELSALAVLPRGRGNPLVQSVLQRAAADPEIAMGCWISVFQNIGAGGAEPGFRLQPCNGDPLVTVSDTQLIEGDRADELRQCLLQLSERSAPQTDIYLLRRGDPEVHTFTNVGTEASIPIATANGVRGAVLSPGGSLLGASECEPFAVDEVVAEPDPYVEVFSPGSFSTVLPSRGLLDSVPVFSTRLPPAANADSIMVPLDGLLYSVDIESGEWKLEASSVNGFEPIFVAPNGEQILTFDGATMFHALLGGTWQAVDLQENFRPERLMHADDERIFLSEGNQVLMIELPQS